MIKKYKNTMSIYIPMSMKMESDQSNFTFLDTTQLEHSHGTINKIVIITAKQNKIERINKMNLIGVIL